MEFLPLLNAPNLKSVVLGHIIITQVGITVLKTDGVLGLIGCFNG
jgi:hypothetical protein